MALAAIASVAASIAALRPRVPSSFRVERDTLIVLDDRGRECWRKVFPYPLHPDAYSGRKGAFAWIGDLAGNGERVVLFTPLPAAMSPEALPLLCFSARGRQLWEFKPGREVRSATTTFRRSFGIARIVVAPMRAGGPKAVLVSSTHMLYYPCQIALLDANGRLLREYWHNGHLNDIQLADTNGDGKNEIYLAGINNAWHAATLVVLDAETFRGVSVDSGFPNQLLDFEAGVERARIILPRSCLNRRFDPYNAVRELLVRPDEIIVETIERLEENSAGIIHHFSPDLARHQAMLSDSYTIADRALRLGGQAQACPLIQSEVGPLWIATSGRPPARLH